MYTHVFTFVISTRERERECMYSISYASYSYTHCCPLFQCLVPPQYAVRSGGCQTEGGSPVEGEGREKWSGEEARSLNIGQE